MAVSGSGDRPGASARLASTLLVVRDEPYSVLMVRRHKDQVFSSALVFPGGLLDPADKSDDWLALTADGTDFDPLARALRIAAIRETFEETGILLARGADLGTAREVFARQASFMDIVRESGGHLFLGDLVPFAHWITPEPVPKRFDTHFFICRAANEQEACCDGVEAVSLEWSAPEAILERAAGGEDSILFPTRMNVGRLAESRSVDAALEAARARPHFTVLPKIERRPGGTAVVIPAEAGYAQTEHFEPGRERTSR